MKPYGHKRKDAQTCIYGCCGQAKSNVMNKLPSDRKRLDRTAKKRARQKGKDECFDDE